MFKKTFVFSAVTVLVATMSVATASALLDTWNRPNAFMDYVSQEMGMYDTRYDLLTESDCRGCHGDNQADRHHYSPLGLAGQCGGCHDIISEPPGVFPIRDCITSGCHSWDDVHVNGWHHDTDLSAAENCVICHSPNLVAPIGPFRSFQEDPPPVVTPTPFSCENCHWDQAVVPASQGFDPITSPPSDAGHPSTYHHGYYDGEVCVPTCYHEYGAEILGAWDTHHLGFTDCSACHSADPNDQSWDPDNPELIRYCETCHSEETLVSIFPHVGPPATGGGLAAYGWEAVGFHVSGSSGGNPVEYRSFEATEICFGCHNPVPWYDAPGCSPAVRINPRGIVPSAGQAIVLVELTGECFGDTYGEGRAVQLKRRVDGAEWIDMPISSWADDRVVFEIPCRTLTQGNYRVRAHNEGSSSSNHYSNQVVFTFTEDG
jgi:hypothetical protein